MCLASLYDVISKSHRKVDFLKITITMVSAVLTLIFFTVATQAQTARQTMEDVSQTLAAGEKQNAFLQWTLA